MGRPKARSQNTADAFALDRPERLQKLLACAGYGSRRACEELIGEGRVTIDGEPVTELGTRGDPAAQDIRVDGNQIRAEVLVHYLLNKPRAVVCTARDPQQRRTVLDFIPEKRRLFSVGRLDFESRGAVILTNDGRFTNLLTHPRYGIEKTYFVRVRGDVSGESMERLKSGVWLSEGRTLPCRVWRIKPCRGETELGVALCEGKNRQVRRMFAKVGHKVLSLTRTRIGPLSLKGLGEGDFRKLKPQEVEMLIRLARKNAAAPAPRQQRSRGSRKKALGKPDPAGNHYPAAAPAAEPKPSRTGPKRRGGKGKRR